MSHHGPFVLPLSFIFKKAYVQHSELPIDVRQTMEVNGVTSISACFADSKPISQGSIERTGEPPRRFIVDLRRCANYSLYSAGNVLDLSLREARVKHHKLDTAVP